MNLWKRKMDQWRSAKNQVCLHLHFATSSVKVISLLYSRPKVTISVKLRIAKLIQFSFLGWPADGVLGAEQMLKRSVNGDDGSVQANSSLNQSKHEQSQEEEEEEGRVLAYPDDCCAGSQDLTSTSNLTKRSRQSARDETMTRLIGDNLRIYLNDDPEVVARYKEEYLREEEEKLSRWFCKPAATEEVGLKSLGSSVLESKVYKVWHPHPQKLIIFNHD